MHKGQTVLITGGTGSFGNAVTKRLLQEEVKEIRIFSRDEKKQEDMRRRYHDDRLHFYIGDIRDFSRCRQVLCGVDAVFHAAALKQVPGCERHPFEAYKTNVAGTENLLLSAREAGVKRLVFLSTDKAVYPINAMGLSKAMMEKLVLAEAAFPGIPNGALCLTRFGNVICSRGSVIPLLIEQLLTGRSMTLTDPDMTRFLMTLEDAADLAVRALENGENGEIIVPRLVSTTMGTLAKAVALVVGRPPAIEIIGARPGEKKHETLVTEEEASCTKERDGCYHIQMKKAQTPALLGAYTSDKNIVEDPNQVAELLSSSGTFVRAIERTAKMLSV